MTRKTILTIGVGLSMFLSAFSQKVFAAAFEDCVTVLQIDANSPNAGGYVTVRLAGISSGATYHARVDTTPDDVIMGSTLSAGYTSKETVKVRLEKVDPEGNYGLNYELKNIILGLTGCNTLKKFFPGMIIPQ